MLTNKLGLPQAIVDAVAADSYNPGKGSDISITSLVNSPRIVALLKQHGDEIEEDASDRIFSLIGQAIHEILRRANSSGIVEERLYYTIDDWVISGQFDRINYFKEEGTLGDYKITSLYTIKYGGRDEWESQLNCYRFLAEKNGYPIHNIEVNAILRDWKKSEAERDKEYPQHQVVTMPIPLWEMEKTEVYIKERIALHKAARIELPFCTPKEMWAQPEKWAVMKKGNKRALKLYEFKEMAVIAAAKEPTHYVENRPAKLTRCESWCNVSRFCSFWQEHQKAKILANVKPIEKSNQELSSEQGDNNEQKADI